ncbi:MAG: hypothetical protein A2987_01065 [Omnitrophica bacterium RIFCSPLOWO2_01_FULL_45_10]|nr:MAG: hypothetical protein A2987_01065 [Omnitrophica bacterium RIFCSPLOWO2_01_FULL_45_10]
MLNEIKRIDSSEKNLREFGLTVGGILVILGLIALWRSRSHYPYFVVPGIFLTVFGLLLPASLKPFHKIWMAFSIIVGFLVSHIILMALFYIVITPIGLILKMFGKDILDERMDRTRPSYWLPRSNKPNTKESYEKQF